MGYISKSLFIKIIVVLIVLILSIPQVRTIIESYYLKYLTNIEIEQTVPSTIPLKISYYAKQQIGITTSYDGSYIGINYPNGDVEMNTGVCTDVVIRALRKINIDLQQLIHEDMKKDFKNYPDYGLPNPDSNIDHRRVPNIQKYFEKNNYVQPITKSGADYRPGDIVTWKYLGRDHIGIVSNIKVRWADRYYIVHNAYKGTELSDWLFMAKITGHYRI